MFANLACLKLAFGSLHPYVFLDPFYVCFDFTSLFKVQKLQNKSHKKNQFTVL